MNIYLGFYLKCYKNKERSENGSQIASRKSIAGKVAFIQTKVNRKSKAFYIAAFCGS